MGGQARAVLGWSLGIGLLLALLLALQLTIGWSALLRPWGEIPPFQLAGAILLILGSYGIRTIRIHRYFHPETAGHFHRSFRLVLLHNLFNNLLPMRSGEASFPILMKREFRTPLGRSLPGLLYLRLLDLHFLLLLGAAVLLGGTDPLGWVIVIFLLPLPFIPFHLSSSTFSHREVAESEGDSPAPLSLRSLRRLVAAAMSGMPRSPRLFWTTWLWTGLNWTTKLLVFARILRAFTPMPYRTALLGSVTGEVSSVLPFHGMAGAGTYEAGILAGLLPQGISLEHALQGAVNLHLFVLESRF